MDHLETHTSNRPESSIRTLDYPALVDTVQLSITRLLDIEGSIEATSFEEVQASIPPHQEHLMDRIGERFDEALISFVTAALVGRRQPIVIRVESSEGFDGWLPWEEKLIARADVLAKAGLTGQSRVHIERFTIAEPIAVLGASSSEREETPWAA